MNRAALRGWLLCGLCCAGASAQAQTPAGPAGERQRLAAERAAVEVRYVEREAACQQRFAVTDCVNDAKKERRDALAPLRRLGAAIDDAQRKQRAAQRREDVRRKVDNAQTREREVVVREAPAAARLPAAAPPAEAGSAPQRKAREATPKPAPRRVTARTAPELPTDAERRAREADAQARIAARKQAAQAHREAVENRNAQRALSGKQADPLPVPPARAAVP